MFASIYGKAVEFFSTEERAASQTTRSSPPSPAPDPQISELVPACSKNESLVWQKRISDPSSVKIVADGRGLRFFVSTTEDFTAFKKAVAQELVKVDWSQEPEEQSIEETLTEFSLAFSRA